MTKQERVYASKQRGRGLRQAVVGIDAPSDVFDRLHPIIDRALARIYAPKPRVVTRCGYVFQGSFGSHPPCGHAKGSHTRANLDEQGGRGATCWACARSEKNQGRPAEHEFKPSRRRAK